MLSWNVMLLAPVGMVPLPLRNSSPVAFPRPLPNTGPMDEVPRVTEVGLDGILQWDFDTVIPGHGPVSTRADLMKFRVKMEGLRSGVTSLLRDGKGKDDIAKYLTDEFFNLTSGFVARMLDR